ncbi:MAG: BrnT family toxin [candidate division KSB1 bacterium]|nr:BrnT family toxin [candidate division KSB1 bacterium]
MLTFEWDPNKAKRNLEIHGVSFDEASTAFKDPLSLVIYDPLHSEEEDRFVLIGTSFANRLLVVIHTESDDIIRIISARKANKNERKYYEKNVK